MWWNLIQQHLQIKLVIKIGTVFIIKSDSFGGKLGLIVWFIQIMNFFVVILSLLLLLYCSPPSQLRSCLSTGCSSSLSSLSVSPGVSRISITSFIIAAKGYAKKEGTWVGYSTNWYLSFKNLQKRNRGFEKEDYYLFVTLLHSYFSRALLNIEQMFVK